VVIAKCPFCSFCSLYSGLVAPVARELMVRSQPIAVPLAPAVGCLIPADGQAGCDSLAAVRLTEFWRRMDEHFGATYAQSVAKDYVLAGLGGRTVEQALAEGEHAKDVWRAVCAEFQIPQRLR
jgi:hypothetical protein